MICKKSIKTKWQLNKIVHGIFCIYSINADIIICINVYKYISKHDLCIMFAYMHKYQIDIFTPIFLTKR